jgi:Mn-dependent DtxR family transcriptional regulator
MRRVVLSLRPPITGGGTLEQLAAEMEVDLETALDLLIELGCRGFVEYDVRTGLWAATEAGLAELGRAARSVNARLRLCTRLGQCSSDHARRISRLHCGSHAL